eukprot:TRINITY_DN7810_c0_g1_i1.p1 TRINITY_DN7810_c0_g1~~TRINITY_DN7810_c0_g1_i1.p1  ORF type:complete len:422 (+),score=52.68 TRINITY_DN7810_c0_g1_i1:111-1376(+)
MPCLPENVVVRGGPCLPSVGGWLGLKRFSAEREERHRKMRRKIAIVLVPAFTYATVSIAKRLFTADASVECWQLFAALALMWIENATLMVTCVACAMSLLRHYERLAWYVCIAISMGAVPIVMNAVDAAPSPAVAGRRGLQFFVNLCLQLLLFKQVSSGILILPLPGDLLYAIRCLQSYEGAPALDGHSSVQNGVDEFSCFVIITVSVSCFLVFITHCLWTSPLAACCRSLLPFHILDGIDCLGIRSSSTNANVAAEVGFQRDRVGDNDFADGRSVPNEGANTDVDIENQSISSGSSASSMESGDSFLPSRQSAKEALLALYVLSRSSWGPNGQALPLPLYTHVAECLGRRHYERFWEQEVEAMRVRTRSHEELKALVEAMTCEGAMPDEDSDMSVSERSYVSSVGSLTGRWEKLMRWFRS